MGVSMSMSARMAVTRIVLVVVAVLMVMMVVMVMVVPAGGAVTFMRSVMCHPFRDP
jgi:hypothetical protein